jgi:hypothetical protein
MQLVARAGWVESWWVDQGWWSVAERQFFLFLVLVSSRLLPVGRAVDQKREDFY